MTIERTREEQPDEVTEEVEREVVTRPDGTVIEREEVERETKPTNDEEKPTERVVTTR